MLQDLVCYSFASVLPSSGSAERIFRTPIPLSYTRHTSRCLVFWLAALPVGLYNELGMESILVCPIVTYFFLGIDQIGVDVEEPFGNLCALTCFSFGPEAG